MVHKLKENQIFVFGSNELGEHLGGAARQAYEKFGAEWGVVEGLTGQCYAFPTLNKKMEKRTDKEWIESIGKLYECARKNPNKEFLLTKVGCGIAGYSEEEVSKSFYFDCPENITKPKGW